MVASRRIANSEETVHRIHELGGEAIFVKTDVSKAGEIEVLVNKTIDYYDRLDYACNNAGVPVSSPLIDISEENWDHVLDVNLKGTWLCLKYEIGAMLKQGGGAIVNVASIGGVIGCEGLTSYCASKGGVIALTRAAALEYAQSGIRINAVSPGCVQTDILANVSKDILARIKAGHPIGRIGKLEEVAEAVLTQVASY